MSQDNMSWLRRKDPKMRRAVAYYRHSAQERQENSIEIQQDQVRAFAKAHGIEIIREFADRGISGLSVEGRDGFNEMLTDYVQGGKEQFDYVLVLDVSRWGRFQETDLSAYYSGLCAIHGKKVVFSTMGFPKEDDLMHGLHMSIERYRAASYSRELSGKVFKGCAKIALGGYWAGGMPPYAMDRLLLDEQRKPVCVLQHGDHKAIHNQRVTLTHGDDREVLTVKRIFGSFTDGMEVSGIAASLNEQETPAPGGGKWTGASVLGVLKNEVYAGVMVWNKTTQRMTSPSKQNPAEEWIRSEAAFEPIVPGELFARAKTILAERAKERARRYSSEDMLAKLERVRDRYGLVNARLIASQRDMVTPATYASRFGSHELAYQALYYKAVQSRVVEVGAIIRAAHTKVEVVDDFFVVAEAFTVRIQPSVPVPSGYEASWTFYPHDREEIDITIGVPLSTPEELDVLCYLVLPKVMFTRKLRVSSRKPEEIALYACSPSEFIKEIIGR